MPQIDEDVQIIYNRAIAAAQDAMRDAAIAFVRWDGTKSRIAQERYWRSYRAAIDRYASLVARSMAFSDLLARVRLVRTVDMPVDERTAFALRLRYSGCSHFTRLPDLIPDFLKLPFKAAIDWFAAREPSVAENAEQVFEAYSRQEFAVARVTRAETARRIKNKILKALRLGGDHAEVIKEFRDEGISDAYAETTFRTEMARATSAGRQKQAMDSEIGDFMVAWEYISAELETSRPTHVKMDGFKASKTNPIWSIWMFPNGWNCYLPGTKVEGEFVAGSKALYSGPAVEIKTLKGRTLRVTINHPILTQRGWIAAGDVTESDTLLSYSGAINDSMVDGVDNQQVPASIEDCFEALAAQCERPIASPTVPLEFHGDAQFFKGEVDIVYANRGLMAHGGKTTQLIQQESLIATSHPTLDRLKGLGPFSLSGFGVGASATRTPRFAEHSFDSFGIPPAPIPVQSLRFGPGARLNTLFFKNSGDDRAADPQRFCEALDALAGFMTPDKVTKVVKYDFTGHVYDLQSVSGWMIADTIVASNCVCSVLEVTIDDAKAMRRWREGRFVDSKPRGVMPDRGFENNPVGQIYIDG